MAGENAVHPLPQKSQKSNQEFREGLTFAGCKGQTFTDLFMSLSDERCPICPVTLGDLAKGGAETVCAACNGGREFQLHRNNCLGISQLKEMGITVDTFGGLLTSLSLLGASNEGHNGYLWLE